MILRADKNAPHRPIVSRADENVKLEPSTAVTRDDERDILTTEAEAVAHGHVAAGLTGSVRHVVEIAVGIGRFVIDGGRNHVVAGAGLR